MIEKSNFKELDITTKIVNVVMTGTLDRQLNLDYFAKMFQDKVRYSNGSQSATYKSKDMSRKVLIFSWGGIISAGNKSRENAEYDLMSTVKSLKKVNIASLKTGPLIQNIVAVINFHTQIDLISVFNNFKKLKELKVIYEPEQFSALMIYISSFIGSNIVVQLFSSGKSVCVGFRKFEDIPRVIEKISKCLLSA